MAVQPVEANVGSVGLAALPGWLVPAGESVDFDAVSGGVFRRPPWSWARTARRDDWARTLRRTGPAWRRNWRWHPMLSLPAATIVKTASEDREYGFSAADSPEVQAGAVVTAVSLLPPAVAGIVFGTPAVLTDDFDDIPAFQGASVEISGGTAGQSYSFAAKLTLSTGRVLVVPARLAVVSDQGG